MHDLIVTALQECRINRAERAHSTSGEGGGKCDGVLFSDAHIETAAGIAFHEFGQPGAVGHGGCYRTDTRVFCRMGQQSLGKNRCVGRRVRGCGFLFARQHVELARRVPLVAGIFGGGIAAPLFGDRMDQDRPGRPRLDGAQDA